MMECRNVRKKVVDWRACETPRNDELSRVKSGDYLRLVLVSGEHFWSEVLSRSGNTLKVRSLDNLPDGKLRIGDEFATSTGAIFRIF